jgi:hypothetical protein
MLADRMVPGGGWNYGNSRVFGENLKAYPDTTAWVLLALGNSPRVASQAAASLRALDTLMTQNDSPLARSLAVLAYRAHGRDAAELRGALAGQLLGPDAPTDTRSRALAVLALAGPAFPFAPGATRA